jgi:hypothetical protein
MGGVLAQDQVVARSSRSGGFTGWASGSQDSVARRRDLVPDRR